MGLRAAPEVREQGRPSTRVSADAATHRGLPGCLSAQSVFAVIARHGCSSACEQIRAALPLNRVGPFLPSQQKRADLLISGEVDPRGALPGTRYASRASR